MRSQSAEETQSSGSVISDDEEKQTHSSHAMQMSRTLPVPPAPRIGSLVPQPGLMSAIPEIDLNTYNEQHHSDRRSLFNRGTFSQGSQIFLPRRQRDERSRNRREFKARTRSVIDMMEDEIKHGKPGLMKNNTLGRAELEEKATTGTGTVTSEAEDESDSDSDDSHDFHRNEFTGGFDEK